MSDLRCGRCEFPRETNDNFCRRCGHQFTVNLPAVRSVGLPQVQRSSAIPPTLIGSVAVLALGTGAEWLARRLAGSHTGRRAQDARWQYPPGPCEGSTVGAKRRNRRRSTVRPQGLTPPLTPNRIRIYSTHNRHIRLTRRPVADRYRVVVLGH